MRDFTEHVQRPGAGQGYQLLAVQFGYAAGHLFDGGEGAVAIACFEQRRRGGLPQAFHIVEADAE